MFALGCTNAAGSGVSFRKIPLDKETQKLWLIALRPSKPPNLKQASSTILWKRITSSITNWNQNYLVVITDRGDS